VTTLVVAISFIYAVVFMSRPALLVNHSNALASVRILCGAEEMFRSGAIKDEDGDGIGEYGTLQELAEVEVYTSSDSDTTRRLLPEELANGQTGGYMYEITVPASPDLAEEFFFITAWPCKYGKGSALVDDLLAQHGVPPFGPTGRMTFCADQSGKVLVADIEGAKGRPEDVENLDVWMTSEEWVFGTSSSQRPAASERK